MVMRMITTQRYELIIKYLNDHGSASVNELVGLTASSTATIRRDLTHLEAEGLLTRIHGGATLDHIVKEASYTDKSVKNLKGKISIAKNAALLIEDGETIFMDAGTTTYEMLSFIEAENLTIVTNSVTVISSLVKLGHKVYLLGGKVKPLTYAIVGSEASQKLSTLSFDKCFLGTDGVDLIHGYSTPDSEEALIKKTALNQSKAGYILADSSKYHRTAFVKFADIEEAVLITEGFSSEFVRNIKDKTIVIGVE